MINLYACANSFRDAIECARDNNEFSIRDRMSQFPRGCCDDASDLFAHFLWKEYHLCSIRVDGTYYADDPENNIWHTWLEVDGIVVDLTVDQFAIDKRIYVESADSFYMSFETRKEKYVGFLSLGDGCWTRMKNLYDAIEKHTERG